MIVVHIDSLDSDEYSDDVRAKAAVLKLAPVGTFIPNVGIFDGTFYVISEKPDEQMYLAMLGVPRKMQYGEYMYRLALKQAHTRRQKYYD
jgi:hypothetical protein